jgi:hypothetical protein
MPCCGQQKSGFGISSQGVQTRKGAGAGDRPSYRYAVYFEYVGNTGLTVFGGVTKKKYRFERPGSRIEVDLKDRSSLLTVPNLREVTSVDGI